MTDDELEASLKALLPPLRTVERETLGAYGYDSEFSGYELAGPTDPADRERAGVLIAAACQPLSRPEIGKELAKVAAVTVPSRRDVDAAAWAVVLSEELQDWPGQTVVEALRRWRKREKWLPTLAEIIEECHQVGRRRRALKDLEL